MAKGIEKAPETSVTQVQQQVITDILNDVRQQVGTTSFNVWFKNAAHFTLDDKELTVGVPNLFVSDYIEARYSKVLAEIASQRRSEEHTSELQSH